jgi:hypothetical protein
MEFTRREFNLSCSAFLLLTGWSCKHPADYIAALRNILQKLEGALGQLGAMPGIPASVVSQAAAYLSAVAKFVDDSAHLLESTAQDWAAKAQQILSWGKAIIPPQLQGSPTVQATLGIVQSAVDGFLRFFQGTAPSPSPLSDADKAALTTIEAEAMRDSQAVKEWAAKS